MLRLQLAKLFGCPLVELDARLPAEEVPLWAALQYIDPWGWPAQDAQAAKIGRLSWLAHRGSKDCPDFADLLTPKPDWRAFDPALREEMEADRLVRNMKSIMRGGDG